MFAQTGGGVKHRPPRAQVSARHGPAPTRHPGSAPARPLPAGPPEPAAAFGSAGLSAPSNGRRPCVTRHEQSTKNRGAEHRSPPR